MKLSRGRSALFTSCLEEVFSETRLPLPVWVDTSKLSGRICRQASTKGDRPPVEERIRLLSLVDIFEPLSEEEIEQLNGQLSDVHLEPNEVFYTPQDLSERLFVLWKGRVRRKKTIFLPGRHGRYKPRLEDITLKGVTARLASLLVLLLESEGVVTGDHSLKIPTHYTHQHLGTMVGANREAITRAFGQLQDEGIVELRRRLIYVPDVDTLRRRAEA